MPEGPGGQEPERLLAGSDRARPLPPALRARLEEALLRGGPARGDGLPQGVSQRLEQRLAARRRWRKWAPLSALGAAAAGVAIVLALAAPGLGGRPTAARSPSGGAASAQRSTGALERDVPGGPSRAKPLPGALGESVAAKARPEAQPKGAGLVARTPARGLVRALRVTPTAGPAAGGNWVLLEGEGVGRAKAVYFGQARALRLERVSADEVRALVPAHPPGTVRVSVSLAASLPAPLAARSAQAAGRASASPPAPGATYTFRA